MFRSTLLLAGAAMAVYAADVAPNSAPNPYVTIDNFFKLPEGRQWGSTSTVAVDSKGHIWIAERCGANSCVGKTVDPVLEFDNSGKLLKSFGSGLLAFPHGIWIDKQDNIWIADGQTTAVRERQSNSDAPVGG